MPNFYDFEAHRVLAVFNYWDTNFRLSPQMQRYFRHAPNREKERRNYLSARSRMETEFTLRREFVRDMVEDALRNCSSLPGGPKLEKGEVAAIWSLDFLLSKDSQYYLIDAAEGPYSAFWSLLPESKKPVKLLGADMAAGHRQRAAG